MEFVGITIIVLAIVCVSMGIKVVEQGTECTIERLGRYTKTLKPGFHIIVPFIERVGAQFSMMEQVLDVPSQEVITKDNAMVRVDGVVFFQILDAARAAYEVRNLHIAIMKITMTNIRTVMGSMDLDELLSQRDVINARLLGVVDDATNPWGIKVTRIEIKDIQPPKDLIDAMGRQMKAEREKRASILEAEGFKIAAINRAEGEKQSSILKAEGLREAAFREAEARERQAEAEARATGMVSEAISKGDVNSLNYFLGQKYIEALHSIVHSPNQKLLMLPVDFANLAGTVSGVGELVKTIIKDDDKIAPSFIPTSGRPKQ